MPGIVGSIQANEAIKWLLGIGETLSGRLLLIDALRMEFRSLDIGRDPECVVCGDAPTVTELIDYEQFCGGGDPTDSRSEERDPMADIDVHELKRRADAGERFQLIDVRDDFEWDICNLEPLGARLVPLATLAEAADGLDGETPLIVHCRSGPRGDRAVAYLRSIGYENAVNLAGGILAWAEAIDPDMAVY